MTEGLCECGCGEPVKAGSRFVRFHAARTPEHRAAVAERNKETARLKREGLLPGMSFDREREYHRALKAAKPGTQAHMAAILALEKIEAEKHEAEIESWLEDAEVVRAIVAACFRIVAEEIAEDRISATARLARELPAYLELSIEHRVSEPPTPAPVFDRDYADKVHPIPEPEPPEPEPEPISEEERLAAAFAAGSFLAPSAHAIIGDPRPDAEPEHVEVRQDHPEDEAKWRRVSPEISGSGFSDTPRPMERPPWA